MSETFSPTPAVADLRRIEMPSLAGLYARAAAEAAGRAVRGSGEVGALPGQALAARSAGATTATAEAYRRLVGGEAFDGVHRWSLPSVLVHVLGFPVQVALMADRRFPLPLMGLVHLSNAVEHRRPIGVEQPLQIRARAENLREHRRGVQVDIVTEVLREQADPAAPAEQDVLWTGTSTYLARGLRLPDEPAAGSSEESGRRAGDAVALPSRTASWRFGADAGRSWAAVSGDCNPIHLSALTAKALGMPSAIAHGMHAAAKMLEGREPQEAGHRWRITFEAPIRLPAQVAVAVEDLGAGRTRITGWDARRRRRHFHGELQLPEHD
ncbi:MaoC/PaaZ C-terminal domain-containing protein [Nesterenkonia halobia]|uniref:MaoC/PaaZ C-terminal domain-containing protein n=1 Tax=Nesterenkonia halobia TaxID=37922 RepID=A0ABP6RDG4_9MICC